MVEIEVKFDDVGLKKILQKIEINVIICWTAHVKKYVLSKEIKYAGLQSPST